MAIIKKTIHVIRQFAIYPVLPTFCYTWVKFFHDWQYYRSIQRAHKPISPGEFLSYTKERNLIEFNFSNSSLEICFIAKDLVRISWSPGTPPPPYAIVKDELETVDFSLVERGKGWILSTEEMSLFVREDGGLEFRDKHGKVLRSSFPPRYSIGDHEQVCYWFEAAVAEEDAGYYGLGERAASLNLRGGSYLIWNTDPKGKYSSGTDPLYLCIPTYVSIHTNGSYLMFYENPHRARFSFDEKGKDNKSLVELRFDGGMLRYYFISGPLERAIQRYTELTGRPLLPPRWALGYHQSRWGYKSQKEIEKIVDDFQKHKLPLSAIHLDIDYMDGYRVFTVNKTEFPDLQGLAKKLAEKGVHLVTIIDPAVKCDPNYFLFQEGIKNNYFCTLPNGTLLKAPVWAGWSAFPDFTSPVVREWWGEQYKLCLELGVDGFWHDMNEPSAFTLLGDLTLPLKTCHHLEGQTGNHQQAHNIYGFLMNRAGFEGLRKHQPQKRPWLLSRSGWAGVGRYAWCWTGDTESSWQALRQTIPTILGMGLSGILFSGPDIGGFSGSPSPELYLRWFQLATFLPFFRTHSAIGTSPREPWRFDAHILEIIRKFLELRYQLIPYLYTLAWQATQTGFPLVRPLFWYNENDLEFRSIDDAFLLGRDILVAPIISENALSRKIKFPKGLWFDFWNDEKVNGPCEIEVPTTLDTIPIFIRAGSILPLEQSTNLDLHIYPDVEGNGVLYSDSGDGYGEWRVDHFSLSYQHNELFVQREHYGNFPFPYKQLKVHIHGMECAYAWVDGQALSIEKNQILLHQLFHTLKVVT